MKVNKFTNHKELESHSYLFVYLVEFLSLIPLKYPF